MNKPWCCYIPDGETINNACNKPAEWRIYCEGDPYDYTEACTEHVGELLTDAPVHHIFPIPLRGFPSDFMPQD